MILVLCDAFHFAFSFPLFYKKYAARKNNKKKVWHEKREIPFIAYDDKMNFESRNGSMLFHSKLFDLVKIISQNFIPSYSMAYILETTEQ